jgi:hypothetical protein
MMRAGDQRFEAENVVIAMANYQVPRVPALARDLNPGQNGEPRHAAGIVEEAPGLYFVGLFTRVEDFMMDSVLESLILDLLEWVTKEERTYEQVTDAWRTSCPKLPVWEDASDRGLITTELKNGRHVVIATSSGIALLQERRLSGSRAPGLRS